MIEQATGEVADQTTEATRHVIRWRDRIKDYIITLVVTVTAAFVLKTFVIEAYRIPTASMENTLQVGDFLLVNKFIYGAKTPRLLPFVSAEIPFFQLPALKGIRRGDVVVFEYPGNRDEVKPMEATNFVKRCIAIGGDTVAIQEGEVLVNGIPFPYVGEMIPANGHLLPPGYCDERMFPPYACFNKDWYGPIVVPRRGDEIVLDRAALREWDTFIRREGHEIDINENGSILIDGFATDTYRVERDYIFVMGDNRDNSLDSRFWGFVPSESVIGEAMFVYWAWNQDLSFWPITKKLQSIRWDRILTIID